MSAGSVLLRLLLPLGSLSLVACGDTTSSPDTAGQGAAGASGQGGSVANPAGGLSILGVVDRQDGNCTVNSNREAKLLALGTLDRALMSVYSAALLVQSTHPERLALQTVDVSLESADGTPYDPYSTPVPSILAASTQGSVTLGLALADLLPATLARRLEPGLLRLRITLHAKAVSDEAGDVVSPVLAFPLELCEGCLVSYPEAARDPASPDGSYLCLSGAPASETLGESPQPCVPGQDTPVSCATCSGAVPLCRDASLNPAR